MRILISSIIGIALVVFVAVQISKNKPPIPPTGDTAVLTVIQPGVSIKKPGALDLQIIETNIDVTEGTEISTTEKGRGRLSYSNGTAVVIAENSHLVVAALKDSGNKSSLQLFSGSLISKIKKILGTDEYYEMRTENAVASVRGTVFVGQFQNNISIIYGIQHRVYVQGWDPKSKQEIKEALATLSAGEKVSINSDALPQAGKNLIKQPFSNEDFKNPLLKSAVAELEPADLEDAGTRKLLERMLVLNTDDPVFTKLVTRLLSGNQPPEAEKSEKPISATSTPIPVATQKPILVPINQKPVLVATPTPTPSPTPATNTSTLGTVPTAQPQATPDTTPTIESLIPKSVAHGKEFIINGTNFIVGRNTKQITTVLLGEQAVQFFISDSSSIFATVPSSFEDGNYLVSIITTSGLKITAQSQLTVYSSVQ